MPTIDVQASAWVSYALAYNRMPFVHSIRVSGLSLDAPHILQIMLEDRGVSLTREFTLELEPDANGEQQISTPSIAFDFGAMSGLSEDTRAELVLTVSSPGEAASVTRHPVDVASSNTWRMMDDPHGSGIHPLSLESLAAFVQPNDPEVGDFLSAVRTRLQAETGSSATQGYQAGPERVDVIATAIWEEARARDIRYSNPPASWRAGQKVRSPRDVLIGRVGTCLDTTVVLAAALEHAGLHPVLFVIEDHAFVGYWREGDRGINSVEDTASAANAVDIGLIRVLETTSVAGGDNSEPFDSEVHERTRGKYLTGDLSHFQGVIDVRATRFNGVLPLPAAHTLQDGSVTVVEYSPTEHSGDHRVPAPSAPMTDARQALSAPVPPRVQLWKNSLLDLSLRNKLINFSERSSIGLAVPSGSLGHVEDLLHAGQLLTLLPGDQITATQKAQGMRFGADIPPSALREVLDAKKVFTNIDSAGNPDVYLRKLRNLAYKARTIEEETGANNLYLALGSLVWNYDGRPLRSPLILIPVTLVAGARRGYYRLKLDESGGSTPNYCLVEKLRQADGLRIPGLENPVEDENGIDLAAVFTSVREALAQRDLPYRVDETADIAVLQFAKFRLWKDLDDHWESLTNVPLVKHLVENRDGEFIDPQGAGELADLDEIDAACPIPADASQLGAIAAAVAGQTFVLEGPPGTGKSQTITNLLARAIAAGKRVLFVAEKRAALDVVSSRLDSVGMGPFSLDLHDKSSKPAAVREQILRALDLATEFDAQALNAAGETLGSSRRALLRYTKRLHEKNNVGHSFYSARTQALAYPEDLPHVPITTADLGRLDDARVSELRDSLRTLEDTADLAQPRPHHPWGFVRAKVPDTSLAVTAAERLDVALDALPPSGPVRDLLDTARTPDDLGLASAFLSGPAVTIRELDEVRGRAWQERHGHYANALRTFVSTTHPALASADPTALDLPLETIHHDVVAATASSFFGRKKRIAAALEPLVPHTTQLPKPKQALGFVEGLVALRGAADTLAPERAGLSGLRPVPGWNPLLAGSTQALDAQVTWLTAVSARLMPQPPGADPFGAAARALVETDTAADQRTREACEAVTFAARNLLTMTGTTSADLEDWLDGAPLIPTWLQGASARGRGPDALRTLQRWVDFVSNASRLRDAGLNDAFDAVLEGRIGSSSVIASFDKGLALASLEERRLSSGLDQFDPQAHDTAVRRFASSAVDVRELLPGSIATDVVAARPFDSRTERGQVGALRRELAKQRRGLKVRELLETYGDLITQVMPCVLVSPDSVARFFPVGSVTFDLVVFDEASQIRVADAIGAMGRSKSTVVVGDSKQMPPTSIAEASDSAAGEDEHQLQPDEESILTEVDQAGVTKRALTWHYRSKDESLIAFSNEHYYRSELSSFPAPGGSVDEHGRPTAGVSLVRVDGQFVRATGPDRGTNRVEAEAIVSEIRRRFARSSEAVPSLGVVTFNLPQRTLIEAMLRDTEDQRIIDAMDGTNGEGLFVKNLENVQGDERDVVFFSTAFSKNDRGVLPLNFGPLTNKGGERRLNVAITRARVQVVVFTSFDPGDLRVEATASLGIKHLAAYMHAAARASSGLAPVSKRPVTDRHRDEIAAALTAAGLVVTADLGLSDFKIDLALADRQDPDRPLVAVLLDGEGWAARRTVGDRDGLPVNVLGNLMGWRAVERVWMPDWLADRTGVIERLVAAVERAGREPAVDERSPEVVPHLGSISPAEVAAGPPQSVSAPSHANDSHVSSPFEVAMDRPTVAGEATAGTASALAAPSDELEGAEPWVAWTSEQRGGRSTLDALPDRRAQQDLQPVLREIIETEGPVHFQRVARLAAGAFGLSRLNQTRIDSIVRCIPGPSKDRLGWAWPDGVDRAEWRSFRVPDAAEPRPVAEIHPLELANAMVALCRGAYGMSEDELVRETLALFGWKRRTEAQASPILTALGAAVTDELLQRSGDMILIGTAS